MDLADAEAPEDRLIQHDDLIGEIVSSAEEAGVQDTIMRAIYQVTSTSNYFYRCKLTIVHLLMQVLPVR